jgi:hypothetical protein
VLRCSASKRAHAPERDIRLVQRPCNCNDNPNCTRCGGRGEIIDRNAGKNMRQKPEVKQSPPIEYAPSGKTGHHKGGPKKK